MRPTAGEVLTELEALWHGCCHNLVYDTNADLSREEETLPMPNDSTSSRSVSSAASSVSQDDRQSFSPAEGQGLSGLGQSALAKSGGTAGGAGGAGLLQSILSQSPPSATLSFPGVVDSRFALSHPHHPASRRFAREVNARMMSASNEQFRFLHESGGAWVVVTLEPPHILYLATLAWAALFDVPSSLLDSWTGRPLRDVLSIPLESDRNRNRSGDTDAEKERHTLEHFLASFNALKAVKGRTGLIP